MNLLVLDTSTSRSALGLAAGDSPAQVGPLEADPGGRHGQGLIPDIQALLVASGLTIRDLDAVAVGAGPGSYTGLRIGLMAAKTFAYAESIPLVGLDSLEAIARNAPDDALRVAVLVDAQRGDVYVGEFARDSPGGPLRRLAPTRIEPFSIWVSDLSPDTMVLGPALDRLPPLWPTGVRLGTVDQGHPVGSRLIELGREALALGRTEDPFGLEPIYLRRSAAEDQWESRFLKEQTRDRGPA